MPLVFKSAAVKVESASETNPSHLATIDTTKLSKIRIYALLETTTPVKEKGLSAWSHIAVKAVEGTDLLYFGKVSILNEARHGSLVVDAVPAKISLFAENPGTYRIYVWGE